ncbi:MAG: cation transporter [Leptolyngbya sp. UWPOB_LEPTO1]|nr:cation transporter [Leptolyngbya sp. UWPOB_LEPTO1]
MISSSKATESYHSIAEVNLANSASNDSRVVSSHLKMRLLWIVLGLRSSLFLFVLMIGLWSHSLSLLASCGDMFSDMVAISLTLGATALAQRPATKIATFGYRRIEILVALLNGLGILAIAALTTWEAIGQFQEPDPIRGLPMLVTAGVSLVFNSIIIRLLHNESSNDLNLKGAFLRILADATGSIGVILAALVIYYFNWLWADAVASLLVATFLCISAVPLVIDSLRILLEFAPRSIDVAAIEAALHSFPEVCQAEKLNVWTITSDQIALNAHLRVKLMTVEERDQLLNQLQTYLNQEFGIYELTLQLTAFQECDRNEP